MDGQRGRRAGGRGEKGVHDHYREAEVGRGQGGRPVEPDPAEHQHDDGVNKAGKPGIAANVTRTIHITMSDKNRFTPNSIKVKQGETIRFVVKNAGKKKHEMVIGSVEDIKAHNELMERFPGMEHDEPNMVDLQSGEKGEIIWQFTEVGQFQFACLVTGHFEAGMKGVINVIKAPVKAKSKPQTPDDHSTHQH